MGLLGKIIQEIKLLSGTFYLEINKNLKRSCWDLIPANIDMYLTEQIIYRVQTVGISLLWGGVYD